MTPGSSRRTASRLLQAALVGTVAVGLVLVALEVGLRLWNAVQVSRERARQGVDPGAERFWATYDEELGYRLTPGFGEVNERGYLGPVRGPKSDRFRVLVLGDSLGFDGDGAADTYVGRLEAMLLSDTGLAPLEVINASVSGYTNYQELAYLRKYGVELEPDLVGVGFVLNDLHRFLHTFRVEDGRIVGQSHSFAEEAEDAVRRPLIRLARRSWALLWLKNRFRLLGRIAEATAADGYTFEYRPDFASAWRPDSWPPIEEQLAEMRQLGRRHGFELFVHLFPYAQQLRSDYLERDRSYVLAPQVRLAEICARLGIPFLDLTPDLSRDHFLDDDVHLTSTGRQLVAERLAGFLDERRLIPEAAVEPEP
ncbi:MAG: SGNH/GDSL hydrolase family protein [Thermoanaerobaculia bacterium]